MRLTPVAFAKTLLGLNEEKDRGTLMELFRKYAKQGDIAADPSKEAWCSDFMNSCVRQAGGEGTGKRNARSWLTYGEKVELKDIKEGDIVIFDFEHDGVHGHVTFFLNFKGMSNDYMVCLGGNQSDNVQTSTYSTRSVIGIRRP